LRNDNSYVTIPTVSL